MLLQLTFEEARLMVKALEGYYDNLTGLLGSLNSKEDKVNLENEMELVRYLVSKIELRIEIREKL